MTNAGEVLDIGCGTHKQEPGAFGIDRSSQSGADVVWDLDRYPWPIEDNRFSRIYMSHIIEHFEDVTRAMAEVHRVAKDGAEVLIVTPHFSSHNSYIDPTHRRHLAARSFEYFRAEDFPTFQGFPVAFDVTDVQVTFGGNAILDNLGRLISGLSMNWYERHAAWIFPAQDIRCRLRVRKSPPNGMVL